MSSRLPALLCFFLLALQGSLAWSAAAADLPDQVLGMKLHGAGVRTVLGLHMYQAGLYLQRTEQDAERIIDKDAPMAMRLVITSSMITKERMRRYIQEGFEKATNGHVEPLAGRIEQAMAAFHDDVGNGDCFDFIYKPEGGVQILKNNKIITTIPGIDFKKALFAIWLGPDPVQKSLRDALLGKKS